ncbi:unnamed protein product [Symbiodinium sp. CCMP2592]|nr:unnamed protein product [Symbiodinium sp. CCMP2592]
MSFASALTSHVPLAKYSGTSDPSKMSLVELIRCLASNCWGDEECSIEKAKQKSPVIVAGNIGPRIWYHAKNKPPSRHYLHVLTLVTSGSMTTPVTSIYHGQLDGHEEPRRAVTTRAREDANIDSDSSEDVDASDLSSAGSEGHSEQVTAAAALPEMNQATCFVFGV